MPIYEFKCAKCGKLTEVVQRVGQRPPPCPHCGSKRMTRAVSRTSFHLKGGGWYADLYATPRPAADKAGAAEPAKAAEEKTEKTAAPAKAEGAGKPTTPASEPAKKVETAPAAATNPPRGRPTPARKRR